VVSTGKLTAGGTDDNATAAYSVVLGEGGVAPAGFALLADGSYTFDTANEAYQSLADGETLDVVVTYEVSDGLATDQGSLTITVTGTNDNPVANALTATATEDDFVITGNLTSSDADNDAEAAYSVVLGEGEVAPAGFTLAEDGSYSFDPTVEAYQNLAEGETLDVVVSYQVSDGDATSVGTLIITVTGTNDVPTGSSTYTQPIINENAIYTITKAQLLQGFSDADSGQTATLSIANLQALNSVTSAPIGTFAFNSTTDVYTFVASNPDFNGTVALAYEVKDVDNGIYNATSSFVITPVNDSPTAAVTNVSLAAVSKNVPNPNGQTVASLFGIAFRDGKDSPAPDTFLGVAITKLDPNASQGVWQWQDTTNAWQPISAVSTSVALFLQANTKIRFVPRANFTGTPESIEARLVEADSSATPNQFNGSPAPLSGATLNVVANINPLLSNSGGSTNISNAFNTVTLSTTVVEDYTKNDFNGDGKADILWRNTNGNTYLYEVNGSAVIGEGVIRNVSNDWQIASTGDFNGDRKADIVWRNTNSGEVYIYQMNGLAVVSEGTVRNVTLDWNIEATGDFNGDGQSDLLWRNTNSGEVYIYQMDGLAVVAEGTVRNVSLDWKIEGTGDFNGDGRSDILWRNNTSGDVYIYQINGTAVANEGFVRNVSLSDWKIEGIDDFNADGKSDILWRNNNNNSSYIYQINGTSITDEGLITQAGLVATINPDLVIAGTGDYNGDSNGDILFRSNTTGGVSLWTQNGRSIQSQDSIRNSVDSSWTISAPTV
jgi:VCBS repeat-containing protein